MIELIRVTHLADSGNGKHKRLEVVVWLDENGKGTVTFLVTSQGRTVTSESFYHRAEEAYNRIK